MLLVLEEGALVLAEGALVVPLVVAPLAGPLPLNFIMKEKVTVVRAPPHRPSPTTAEHTAQVQGSLADQEAKAWAGAVDTSIAFKACEAAGRKVRQEREVVPGVRRATVPRAVLRT